MSHEPAEKSMETTTQKPTENGQPGSLRSGDLLGWIDCNDRLPDEGANVECMWDMDDSVTVEEMAFRHTGRPTDYGYTPGCICLPEGVYRWRPLPNDQGVPPRSEA